MRFISILRAPERLGFPPPALAEQLAAFGREAAVVHAGTLLPAVTATWVAVRGGELAVTEGPGGTADPVAAYAVYDVATRQEVVEWSNRLMQLYRTSWPGWSGEVEIRQVV
jgi:hypothetical protein